MEKTLFQIQDSNTISRNAKNEQGVVSSVDFVRAKNIQVVGAPGIAGVNGLDLVEKYPHQEKQLYQEKQLLESLRNVSGILLQELQQEEKKIKQLLQEGYEKEQSFSNFVSPENAMGFSTRITGEKTFTAIKLESLENVYEMYLQKIRILRVFISDVSRAIASDTPKSVHALLYSIGNSPEGGYLRRVIEGENKELAQEIYILEKARWLSSFGGYAKDFAEEYYTALKDSRFKGIADIEKIQFSEKFHKQLTKIANGMLSYDQLAIFAASGGVGTLIAKGVSQSSTAMEIAQAISKLVDTIPTNLAKVVIPGKKVIETTTSDTVGKRVASGTINIGSDILKFSAIHSAAEATGSESFTKMTDLALAALPGVAHGYSSEMQRLRSPLHVGVDPIKQGVEKSKDFHVGKDYPTFRVHNGEISISRNGFLDHAALRSDLISYFQSNPEVRAIRLPNSMPTEGRKIIMDLLSENRPLLGVLRIMPNSIVLTYVFEGIKRLNDQFGQQTVDEILFAFKTKLREELHQSTQKAGNIRLITNDYKKMSVAMPFDSDTAVAATQLSKEKTQAMLEEILKEKAFLLVRISKDTGIPLEKVYSEMRTLSVGIGSHKVGSQPRDIDLLESLYESERGARRSQSVVIDRTARSNDILLRQGIGEYMQLKQGIIDRFGTTKFEYSGKIYPSIIRLHGEHQIHPLIYEAVRKPDYTKSFKPIELAEEVRKLTMILNRELDYIAPVIRMNTGFEEARIIESQFRSGLISRVAFETNYKGFATKHAFYERVKDKEGLSVFIDIKAMDRENRALLEIMASKIHNGQSVSTLEKLDVVGPVTKRMLRAVESFRKMHPGVEITVGGDEILFFAPGIKPENSAKYISEIRDLLSRETLNVRIASEFGTSSSRVFDKLDGRTKLSKYIEQYVKLPDGSTPPFLRHVEITGGNIDTEAVLTYLRDNPQSVTFAISSIAQTGKSSVIPLNMHENLRLTPSRSGSGIVIDIQTNVPTQPMKYAH